MTSFTSARLRELCLGALLVLAGLATATAQSDFSVAAITQPVSGCALSNAEPVSIRVFNYGDTVVGPIILTVAYTINSGTPVVDTIFTGTRPSNSSFNHTFMFPADLSAPGTHTIDATVSLPGDVNPANDALVGRQVLNAAPSLGGTLTGPSSFTTSGTLTLAGQVGAIAEWQQSIDGERWRSLENTSATQLFANLDRSTRFRVQVQSAPCAPALSNTVVVNPTDTVFANGFE